MGLISLAVAGLRGAAQAVESLEQPPTRCYHGTWCERSQAWEPENADSRIVPLRVADEYLAKMLSPDGWEADIDTIHLHGTGDGTFHMFFKEAEDIDFSANRNMQRMVFTALDLVQALDVSNCDLNDDVVEALAEFKKASRSRLSHDS